MRHSVPAILPLFRSEDQLRILGALTLEPARSWTADELTAATRAPRASVHRELQRAVAAGLVTRDGSRRPHEFRAATDSPVYQPLRDLLELTVGVESQLRELLANEGGVEAAVLHGSWARAEAGPGSDVDVVVVGDPDLTHLRRAVRDLGRSSGRRI